MTSDSLDYNNLETPKSLLYGCVALSLLAIAFLFWLIYGHESSANYDVSSLAAVNAALNACSAVSLIAGFVAIKKRNWQTHRNLMLAALFFSALFLVSYIVYHTFHGDSKFLGQGLIRPIYFFILISHILLSIFALPMVLISVSLSLTRRFSHHKKWARWTFPIWTYVSVTGVLVFFLLKTFGSSSG